MIQGQRFRVEDGRSIRGVTFLQNGQRYESWLPVGLWEVDGPCNLTTGRGDNAMQPALKIHACGAGNWGTWYVNPQLNEDGRIFVESRFVD